MGEGNGYEPQRRAGPGERNGASRPTRMSDHVFGVAFAAVLAVIGAVEWIRGGASPAWLFIVSGALLVAGLLTPELLSPLNALRARLLIAVRRSPLYLRISPAIRIIWWNTLALAGGLLLIALLGEGYLRWRAPFTESTGMWDRVAPKAGLMLFPDMEMRFTNKFDYWTTARTNSLGFLDREPPAPDIASASCHIAAIGDSFVEAIQVAVEDKFHIRLEEMAEEELPDLDVTTSAYGISVIGQTHQLALYDEYARPLRPNLVALVFVDNDFADNSPALYAMKTGYGPDGIPYVTAARNADGTIALRPVNDDVAARLSPVDGAAPQLIRIWGEASRRFLFARWLRSSIGRGLGAERYRAEVSARAEELILRPGYESALDGWDPADIQDPDMLEFFVMPAPPPVFQEALALTAFALDEFVNRTERDGAELVILASHTMGPGGDPLFERMADMARERGIPVINQSDYVARQGGKIEDAHFAHDIHWSAQGHQWAAEALLEWLRGNPQVCDDADAA